MFMKHTISRFFRFFLVAALVAAMAGSLLPAKVAGQSTNVTVTPTSYATGEATGFTITFNTDVALEIDTDDTTDGNQSTPIAIAITGAGVTFAGAPGAPAMTAPGSLVTVNGVDVVDADGLSFSAGVTVDSPVDADVGDLVTVVIASHYADDPATTADGEDESTTAIATNDGTPGEVSVTVTAGTGGTPSTPATTYDTYVRAGVVSPTSLRAGASAEWEIDYDAENIATALVANADRITVTFSSGTVPSSIGRDDILVRAGDNAERLTVAPTVSGRAISFLSPIAIATTDDAKIVISASVGIAAGNSPGGMAVTVKLGTNIAAVSTPVSVGQYLDIRPGSAARNGTVTVTGGGFTAGTSGAVLIEDLANPGDIDEANSTGGTYTVDSSGKLTGSFVASAGTAAGGRVAVEDLGTGAPVWTTSAFDQKASATPAATEITRGDSISVSLSDFPMAGAAVTADIVDEAATVSPTSFAADATSGKFTIMVSQSTTPGTKRVTVRSGGESASFLITVVSRTLTVSPSSAVPGQAITVSGAGFGGINTVDLTLTGGGLDERADDIRVNTDGTFLYTGRVPFTATTASSTGSKTWTASGTDNNNNLRSASSSGFSIQARSITLSPSTANPGATVEVFGSGWGVRTHGNATSQVTLEIEVTGTNPRFGPFPISSTGEFTGAITVPSDQGVTPRLSVIATDNNGTDATNSELTQGFPDPDTADAADGNGNQTATKTLNVPTGVISVTPDTASTGSVITVTGQGFPSQTNLSTLTFGDGNALPVPAPATDVSGNFTVTLTVPAAAQGGSLPPGAVVITARVGQISGTTSFTIPGPSITLSSSSAAPGGTITVSGTNFGAYSNVGTINVGQQNQAPTPNPLTDATGNFSSSVLIPALNPGAYTITVRTAAAFTATASINIVSATAGGVTPEIAFQALTTRGILTLAAAAAPGGTVFGAYVPGLDGNTLVQVDPNGVLILTLNADARISVSSQPAVDVKAGTPTFFALGANVSVEVIE